MGRLPCQAIQWSFAFIGLCACLVVAPTGEAQERAQRSEDLRDRVVPVRTLDPVDEDFSDLAGLSEAIGGARVVQLGESSHGAGRTFAAKTRLVKFLHRELGFDVLVWESGMYGLRTVNDSLRAGADPVRAAAMGIFPIWSRTEEVRTLLEYARDSHAGGRPLEMAGVDVQFSGRESRERFAAGLRGFAAALESGAVRETAVELVGRTLDGFARITVVDSARAAYVQDLYRSGAASAVDDSLRAWYETRGDRFTPTDADLDRFLDTVDRLLEHVRAEREAFVGVHGDREVAWLERILGNVRQQGIRAYLRVTAPPQLDPSAVPPPELNRAWNLRDTLMADNLLWLARERYPDRRLVVWGHNGHVMNAHYVADWSTLSHRPVEEGMKPMGAYVSEEMGEGVYTIAFTAHSGEARMTTAAQARTIAPAPPGSLEDLLHGLGHEHVFLDFRALPADHWLRRPSTMAIREYMPERMDDWTRVVDGVFFVDRMEPPTPVR